MYPEGTYRVRLVDVDQPVALRLAHRSPRIHTRIGELTMGNIIDLTTLATSRDHALAWTSSKSVTAKKSIHAQVVAKSKTSKRVRWTNLAKAMAEGDMARVNAYGQNGEAKAKAWAAVKAANAPATAKPKAKAKVASAKPKANPASINALAKQIAGMDEAMQAAFLTAFAQARK